MTTQEGAKRRRPIAEETEEVPKTVEAPITSDISVEDLGLSTRTVTSLTDAGLETAQDILDMLAQGEADFLAIRGVGDKTLEEVRMRLVEKGVLGLEDEGAEVEPKHQAGDATVQAELEAERALEEAGEAMEVKADNSMKLSPTVQAEEGSEQPVTFIVRLTVDKQGQPLRTEIRHAHGGNGKKETFPGLDVQRLAAFMETCIRPSVTPELSLPTKPPPASVEAPTPEPLAPTTGLTVADVQVFRMRAPGTAVLVLSPDEAFVLQARFQLEGPEALSLTAQESSFEVKVYAREVNSGTSTLLTTYSADLVRDVFEYSTQMQVSGLSPGLYRLRTLVTLRAPINMRGHHEGSIVHVAGIQQSINPVAALTVPLSQ